MCWPKKARLGVGRLRCMWKALAPQPALYRLRPEDPSGLGAVLRAQKLVAQGRGGLSAGKAVLHSTREGSYENPCLLLYLNKQMQYLCV